LGTIYDWKLALSISEAKQASRLTEYDWKPWTTDFGLSGLE